MLAPWSPGSRQRGSRSGLGSAFAMPTIRWWSQHSRSCSGYRSRRLPGHMSCTRSRSSSWRDSGRAGRSRGWTPTVAVIVAAHDEESVIERRVENLLALDYPARQARDRRHLRRLDRPHPRARAPLCRSRRAPQSRRGGKVAAQDRAVRETESARSSPSPMPTPPGRRTPCARSCSRSPIPASHTSAGSAPGQAADGSQPGGRLLALRDGGARRRVEARLGHRRQRLRSTPSAAEAYVEVDPRFGHDLSFPYLMVQHGYRAVYEPAARRVREADHRRTRTSTAARCACSSTAG